MNTWLELAANLQKDGLDIQFSGDSYCSQIVKLVFGPDTNRIHIKMATLILFLSGKPVFFFLFFFILSSKTDSSLNNFSDTDFSKF